MLLGKLLWENLLTVHIPHTILQNVGLMWYIFYSEMKFWKEGKIYTFLSIEIKKLEW